MASSKVLFPLLTTTSCSGVGWQPDNTYNITQTTHEKIIFFNASFLLSSFQNQIHLNLRHLFTLSNRMPGSNIKTRPQPARYIYLTHIIHVRVIRSLPPVHCILPRGSISYQRVSK